MPISSRLLPLVLTVAVTLVAATSGASANDLSLSDTDFRMSWAESFGIDLNETPGLCSLTLSGAFHDDTFAKAASSLVGVVDATTMSCEEALVVQDETLPWHVLHASYAGTLPDITSITSLVVGMTLMFNPGGFACLLRTTPTEPLRLTSSVEEGFLESVQIDESVVYRLHDTRGFLCDGFVTMTMEGVGWFDEGPEGGFVQLALV
jgi:hypothetical protein